MLPRIRFSFITLIICLLASAAQASPIAYTYDNAGRLTMADYGEGKSVTYIYDANGNLTRREVQVLRQPPGSLRVNITPNTAQWRRVSTPIWRDSGATENNIFPGDYRVEFSIVPGHNTQAEQSTTIESGQPQTLNVNYSANANQYAVSASTSGQGGRVTGGNTYQHNALVRLEAIANRGFAFVCWKDSQSNIVSTRAILEFRATKNQALTAHFRKITGLGGVLLLLME